MTRDPRLPSRPESFDDATIGKLVRDVADAWTMPPVRLDSPSWRDRVRSPGARRLASAGGWLGRVGQAATAAVALTVVGALVAVILTQPPDGPGKSPAPSGGTTPPTEDARPTSLPKLLVEGDLPSPTEFLVGTERGDFALVDLATGTIGGPLTGARYGSELRVLGDGSMLCLCVFESGNVGGSATNAKVSIERYDASGKHVSSTPVEGFGGEPDPRDEGRFIPERPPHVATAVSFSADGRRGFVGWSTRAHPAWQTGLLVVDLETAAIVGRLPLPDGSTGEGDARRVVQAPRVIGSTGADGLLIARGWYEWSPATSETASYRFENDVYRVRLAGGVFSDLAPVPNAADCGHSLVRGGALPNGGMWLACSTGGAELAVVRRLAADGSLLGDVRVNGGTGIDTDASALSRDGTTLYVWDPSSATMTRVDLATGERFSGSGTAAADGGPLAAFGRWLAPATAAKSMLAGAIVISPDGTRVYAIGIKEGVDESDMVGSAGVFVFDANSLERLGTWQPTADYVSIAVSGDGQFVYAAGLPSFDARGASRLDQQASITVFDALDGRIRLIAGRLAGDMISFPNPTLD